MHYHRPIKLDIRGGSAVTRRKDHAVRGGCSDHDKPVFAVLVRIPGTAASRGLKLQSVLATTVNSPIGPKAAFLRR